MKRIRRMSLVAAATLVLLAIPGAMSARSAEGELFGFRMSATASAISFVHNQPSFGIPSDPTFELRKVYALADLDSGPTGHGLGSVLWPGQVAGNASTELLFDTLLFNPTQLGPVQETCLPDGVKESIGPIPVPTPLQCYGITPIQVLGRDTFKGQGGWPIRAEAFHPQGPPSKSQDLAAGVRSAAIAKADEVQASATTGGSEPGPITFGTLLSQSNSRVEGGLAIAESLTKITDLNLFGAIHIEQVLARGRSASDGLKAKNQGSLSITGMTIVDPTTGKEHAKILVDSTGFHAGDQNADPLGKQAAVIFKKYLEPNGIHLFAGVPKDILEGASGSRELAGLTVQLEAKGMKQLLDGIDKAAPNANIKSTLQNPTGTPLSDPIFGDNHTVCDHAPPDSPCSGVFNPTVAGYVASFFQGDQIESFIFGYLKVESAASPPFEDVIIPPVLPPLTPPAVPPVTFPPGAPGFIPQPQTGGGGYALGPLTPVGVKGIPFTYIALAIAVAAFGATRLRLFADSVMAAPATVRCPLEE